MEKFKTTYASNDQLLGVYYRLYLDGNNLITVVCLQHFDEIDYYDYNFVRNSEGEKYFFDEEEDAIRQLNEWYKSEEIDPEYRRSNSKLLIR